MFSRAWWSFVACGLLACTAPEGANRSERCLTDSDCSDGLSCYRGFCIEETATDEAGAEADDAGWSESEDAGSVTEAEDAGAAPRDAGAVAVADAGAPVTPPSTTPTDAGAPAAPADAGATPATPADAGAVADAGPADAGAPDATMPWRPGLPWPLGDVPLERILPCINVFDDRECRKCVQRTLKVDPKVLCGDDKKDDDDAVQPVVCSVLCLGDDSRERERCRRGQ